jgi:hypothetical protein
LLLFSDNVLKELLEKGISVQDGLSKERNVGEEMLSGEQE